jgi:hypothetical protein
MFVRSLHPPFFIRLQLAVQTLQSLANHNGFFMSGGLLVRQFLALVIEFGTVVVGVKKISGHVNSSYKSRSSS